MTDLTGKTLGQYTLTREIGRGGMAVVYEAYQASLGRHVAIKALPPQFTFDGVFVERFLQEARAAARLAHPNIVPIYDVGNQDGQYYIVMQKLPGESLSSLIAHTGRLPLPRAAHIVAQVASALDYAHQRGFVHRDVKPANIIAGPEDHVWLTDFGIARAMEGTRLTQSGMVMGTPEYMSPEQAQGEEPGPRGDVYALGIVLYEMLAGRAPFQGSTPLSVLHKQVYDAPPAVRSTVPDLPPAIEAILGRALAKDPDKRYATAGELARAVQGTVQASAAPPTMLSPAVAVSPRPRTPTPPRPVTPPAASPAPEPARSRRFPVLPIIAGAAAVVLLVVLAVLSSRKVAPPASASLPALTPIATAAPVTVMPTSTLAVAPAFAVRPVTITVEMPPAAPETQDTTPTVTLAPAAATVTPLPTNTLAPTMTSAPTATPIPLTFTPLPSPPRPAPTATRPAPTATRALARPPSPTPVAIPAPVLRSPENGANADGVVNFQWSWPGPAQDSNHGWEVRIWRDGQPDHYGAAGIVRSATSVTIDVWTAYGVQQGGAGRYFWTVALVQIEPYQRIGPEAPPRTLNVGVAGGGGGGEPPKPPVPTSPPP